MSHPAHPSAATPLTDTELTRRSILGFGELAAALGRGYAGPTVEIRWPNALGARLDAAAGNPWFDAAVVPPGAVPPADDPRLPLCLWTLADAAPGRIEMSALATPCLGVALNDPLLLAHGAGAPLTEAPSLEELGNLNEQAYGETGFTFLVRTLHDARIRRYGLRRDGAFVCVALALTVDEDVSIHYVATAESCRRQGLASQLVLAILTEARQAGRRSATLQASSEGLPVWQQLGFRQVATLRGYLRTS